MDNLIQSVSERSFGEVRVDNEYNKIENEIRKQKQKKSQKQEIKQIQQGQIPNNQQLGEFLTQLQNVSNHNLQVATTYMLQLQQAELQLQKERESSFNALREKEHLQRKYDEETEQNKKIIHDLTQENNFLTAENIRFQGETQNAFETVKEKENVIQEKKQLIENLHNSYQEIKKEILYLRDVQTQNELKIKELLDKNVQLKLEENAFQNLQKEKEDQEKRHTKECEDLRKDAFEKYQSMIREIRKREGVEKDQEPLRKEVQHLMDKLEENQKNLNNSQIENKLLKDELQTLKDTFNDKLKRETYETQTYNLNRIVTLEKNQQKQQDQIIKLETQNQQYELDINKKEGEIEFYIKEYKNFDNQMNNMQKEREQYLQEFNRLKKKYEKCIEVLQKDLNQAQFQLLQQQEEHKTTKMHLNRNIQKVQDMIEMQQLLNIGDKYYEDKVKEKTLEDHVKGLTAKEYRAKTNIIQDEIDIQLKDDLQKKQEVLEQQEDDFDKEWNSLYRNIESVENKLNTNQEQLDYLVSNTNTNNLQY